MIKQFFKYLSDKIHTFVGSWAYFIGSVMADGYIDRMEEYWEEQEEEENKTNELPQINVKVNTDLKN